MNIQRVKAFVLAAQLGSVSAAARQLSKRQPQVSQWIAELEVDLGVKLFERGANQVELSLAGEHLLPRAILALSQWEQFSSSAAHFSTYQKGVICLGVESHIPLNGLITVIDTFFEQFPTINFVLQVDKLTVLDEAFSAGNIDLLLRHQSDELHLTEVGYCRIGQYKEVLLVSRQSPLSKQAIVAPSELATYREYVWAGGQACCEDLEVGFSGHYCLIPDLGLLKKLLISGHGYAFLPLSLAQTEIDQGLLTVVKLNCERGNIERGLELRWHFGFESSALGLSLLDLIKNQLSELT